MSRTPDLRAPSRDQHEGDHCRSLPVRDHQGDVVDFNRFGVTVALRRPLPINKPLLVSLKYSGSRLDEVVGAAHHCRFLPEGTFRCGIRFRTDSPIQLDRDETEQLLETLERKIAESLGATAT
jgi:hypothetical protein